MGSARSSPKLRRWLTPFGSSSGRAFAATVAGLEHAEIDVPADLDERVRAYIAEHPEVSWDAAVAAIVKGEDDADAD